MHFPNQRKPERKVVLKTTSHSWRRRGRKERRERKKRKKEEKEEKEKETKKRKKEAKRNQGERENLNGKLQLPENHNNSVKSKS